MDKEQLGFYLLLSLVPTFLLFVFLITVVQPDNPLATRNETADFLAFLPISVLLCRSSTRVDMEDSRHGEESSRAQGGAAIRRAQRVASHFQH